MPEQAEAKKLKIPRVRQLGRAVQFVWQSARGWTIANGILVAVQGLLPLLPLYLMKLLVDAVTAGAAAPDKGAVLRHVLLLVALTAAATLFTFLIDLLAGMVSEWQGYHVADHMNDVILAKSIEVDLEYYESARYYDTLHRAQREASSRPISIVNGLAKIGQNSISLLAIAGLLLSFHWLVAATLFAAVISGTAVRMLYSSSMYRWQREQTPTERQAGYLNWMLTDSGHAKEIRLFDLGPLFIRRFRDVRRKLRRGRLAIMRRRSIADFAAQIFATSAIYGSYAFISYQALRGTITLGELVMYYQAFQRVQGFFQGILGSLAKLYEDNLFLSNLYEFLDLKRTVSEPVNARPVPQPMQHGIVIDHVSFQYPEGSRKVLEDVSLTIRPGEVVALVGENGSGKTTLIKLLCRLYDPTSGAITMDGVDLRQFETKALRSEIAIIFQDYAHYHLTARENIWLGNATLAPDHERVMAAARRSGADEVIRSLPHGYDTILGKRFADGEELSIGEWQKVALARAFMRDAQIIVLDEPTSSMDAKAEYEAFQNFRQLLAGRTAILISHRFSTVRMADRIYVLQHGRVSEGGSHEELITRRGVYADLFERQARSYR
ncbi:MAG: ABC transporter ATP-binding protein [Acidobacteriota bacterium]|nr:ABC transporter ATP-binding protein [Acidobacteriota bacterium]